MCSGRPDFCYTHKALSDIVYSAEIRVSALVQKGTKHDVLVVIFLLQCDNYNA